MKGEPQIEKKETKLGEHGTKKVETMVSQYFEEGFIPMVVTAPKKFSLKKELFLCPFSLYFTAVFGSIWLACADNPSRDEREKKRQTSMDFGRLFLYQKSECQKKE